MVPEAAGQNGRSHLEAEIRKAHVICVVYAIDNANSFHRIPMYWLPYFRSLGVNVRLSSWNATNLAYTSVPKYI
jgi:mitochondrial Rho GTPase 1